jgi:transcriptional regulator with XRE-family HTH domain
MSLAENIKSIREENGLLQKDVATHIGVDKSTYSKIEKGTREVTVSELQKKAQLFNISLDQLVNYDGNMPKEVVLEEKNAVEQMRLIQQLEEEDKQTVFKIIDTFLTKKKFKDFFQKNVAVL